MREHYNRARQENGSQADLINDTVSEGVVIPVGDKIKSAKKQKTVKVKLADFVIVPRTIPNDYLSGKLSFSEFIVIVWLFLKTNPFNGDVVISYKGLVDDLRGFITPITARKVISELRRKQFISFQNHRGRTGSFIVKALNFYLSSKELQTKERIRNHKKRTTASQPTTIPLNEPRGEPYHQNHNYPRSNVIKI